MKYVKNMFDIIERAHERHVRYKVSVGKFWNGLYIFEISKSEVESWYKGEDSGARYPEYDEFKDIEIYDLTPVLDNMLNGMKIKDLIDKVFSEWPPHAGELYTPDEWYQLYYYLDEYPDIKKLKVDDLYSLFKSHL